MQLNVNWLEFLGIILNVASALGFSLWSVVFLSGILNWRRKLRNLPGILLFAWALFLILRVVVVFIPQPFFILFDPLNTFLFVITGIILVVIQTVISIWQTTRQRN